MKVELKDGKLVIELDVISPPVASKSGKSMIVATTSGIVGTGLFMDGKELKVGVNAFVGKES